MESPPSFFPADERIKNTHEKSVAFSLPAYGWFFKKRSPGAFLHECVLTRRRRLFSLQRGKKHRTGGRESGEF